MDSLKLWLNSDIPELCNDKLVDCFFMDQDDMHDLRKVKKSFEFYQNLVHKGNLAKYSLPDHKDMLERNEKHIFKVLDRCFFEMFKEHVKARLEQGLKQGANTKNQKKKAQRKL